jgi:hypothetical protein
MFEHYTRNIDPEEARFRTFLSDYIADKGVKDVQALPYSELYKVIKEGIREYLRRQEPRSGSEK